MKLQEEGNRSEQVWQKDSQVSFIKYSCQVSCFPPSFYSQNIPRIFFYFLMHNKIDFS